MTLEQATELNIRLLYAFPASNVSEETQRLYVERFVALPYERTNRAIDRIINTHTGAFLPTVAEVLCEAGVYANASDQLQEAMREGVELVSDLGSDNGWAVGVARIPLPPDPDEARAIERAHLMASLTGPRLE